jgi:hypothetical protein
MPPTSPSHPAERLTRRAFALTALALLGGPRLLVARGRRGGLHPTPRPGITAANVLPVEQLADHPDAVPVFDLVREIPEIVDGIRCQCGCADLPGFYSLLSCYESEGMARHCVVCQGEARLAYRLHKAGESLDSIRSAIDARFG